MFQFLVMLVAVLAVLGVIYVLYQPRWAFILIIAMFPLEQLLQSYVPALARNPQYFNFAVAGLAGFAVVTRIFRRDPLASGLKNPVSVLTYVFYALWMVGLLYTIAPRDAVAVFFESYPYWILLLGLLPLLVTDIEEFRRLIHGLMLLGTIVAVLILLNPVSSYYQGRFTMDLGMTGSRDDRGSPLALAELGGLIALAAALIRTPAHRPWLTLLRAATFFSGFGLAIGSGSRGQVLAAGITGVAFYPLARRLASPRQFFLNVIGFGVLVGGIYLTFRAFIGQQNIRRWDIFQMFEDMGGRLDMVWELFAAWLASPSHWLFGLGPSAYVEVSGSLHANYVHNIAAEVLCEHGIVGAALFLGIVFFTIRSGARLWSTYRHDPTMRSTVAVLLAFCVYGLLLALKQGSISYPAPLFWWLVLAKIGTYQHKFAPAGADAEAVETDWEVEADEPLETPAFPDEPDPDGRDYALGY